MIIFDIEASGLSGDSYPIQIALYDPERNETLVEYIRPHDTWTYWDDVAEDIHKIPLQLLYDVGKPIDEVVTNIIEFMKQSNTHQLYCDAPDFDGFWLSRLYDASTVDGNTWPVEVLHVLNLCQYEEEARHLIHIMQDQDRPHDALEDCKMIWDAVKMATK